MSARSVVALLVLDLVALASLGCGRTATTSVPRFPTEDELAEIQSAPRPSSKALFPEPAAAADHWQLASPLPTTTTTAAYAGPDPVLRQLAARYASDGDRRVTEGMSCYAHEQGRFFLAHGKGPAEDIEAFMATRCGSVTRGLVRFQYRERSAGAPPATIASVSGEVDALVSSTPRGSLVGVWVGSNDRYDMVSVATAVPEVELDAVPITLVAAGFVDVTGTIAFTPDRVESFVTRGDRGYARCEPLPGHAKRSLALRCPVSPSDAYAVVEVYAARPGEVLARSILSLMVLPPAPVGAVVSGERVQEYRAPVLTLPVDAGDHSAASYLASLNSLRRQQLLEPMSLSQPQSEMVEDLLPHYLAARSEGDAQLSDQIALGMFAGWKVSGTIRDASLYTYEGHHSSSIERSLSAALFSPSYRAIAFDPAHDVLALGALADETREARAYMLLTYDLFEPRAYVAERAALLDALDRERAALGRGPVQRIEGPKTDAVFFESVGRIQSGTADPVEELERVLQVFVDTTNLGFQGQVLATLVLDGWQPEFPRDLLHADHARVAMMVTHRKAPGSTWGEHVVMMLYTLE